MVWRFIFSSILFLLILPLSCVWTMLNKLKNVFCIAVYIWLVIAHDSTFTARLALSYDIISWAVSAWNESLCGPSSLFSDTLLCLALLKVIIYPCEPGAMIAPHVSFSQEKFHAQRFFVSKNILFLFMCSGIDYYYALLHCYIIIRHTVEGNHNSVTCLLDSDKLKPSPGLRSVNKIIIATEPSLRLRGD